jgi:hypothetical protein
MASTYSALKIQLMGTGENSGTWGNVTNDNLGVAIEEAIAESADVAFTGSNVTISLTDTNASQTARNLRLNLTGTGLGATTALTVPDIEKPYIINNGLSDAVEVKNSTGSNVTVPAGKTMWVYSTGSNVVDVTTHATSLTLGTPLAITQGGTGSNSATFSGANITSINANNISSGILADTYGGTGINALGTNVATFLGTPSSANLAAAVTDETGTGALVFANTPTLVSPVLGTPTSGQLSGCTVDGTDAVGFRNTPVNSQSAAYTLVLADSGKTILHPIADDNARTFTIPANSSVAYPVGTVVTFVNLINTVTIAITTDTMYLGGDGSTGSRTLAAYGVASAVKVASTTWVISGNGLT